MGENFINGVLSELLFIEGLCSLLENSEGGPMTNYKDAMFKSTVNGEVGAAGAPPMPGAAGKIPEKIEADGGKKEEEKKEDDEK